MLKRMFGIAVVFLTIVVIAMVAVSPTRSLCFDKNCFIDGSDVSDSVLRDTVSVADILPKDSISGDE